MSPFEEWVELVAMSLDAIWLDAPVPRSMTKTAGCLVAMCRSCLQTARW